MIATATLTKLLEELKNLTDEEIAKLFSEVEVEKSARVKGGTNKNQIIACPHCGSIATVKSGKTAAGDAAIPMQGLQKDIHTRNQYNLLSFQFRQKAMVSNFQRNCGTEQFSDDSGKDRNECKVCLVQQAQNSNRPTCAIWRARHIPRYSGV